MISERKVSHDPDHAWMRSPLGAYTGLLFTGLFALGSFLVILFMFLPMIDEGRIATLKAEIASRDDREKQADAEVEDAINTLKLNETQAAERKQKRAEDHKTWLNERAQKEQKIHDLQTSASGSSYAYRLGTMIGFILLTFAGLGYLHFGTTPVIRIVGAVVVTAIVLLVFWSYLPVRPGH